MYYLSPQLHMNEGGEAMIVIGTEYITLVSSILNLACFLLLQHYLLHSLDALQDLWRALKYCAQHNKNPALFTLAAIHFQMLVELKGGAPVVVLYGEPNVGKTTIANALMSVAGIEACRMRRDFLFT